MAKLNLHWDIAGGAAMEKTGDDKTLFGEGMLAVGFKYPIAPTGEAITLDTLYLTTDAFIMADPFGLPADITTGARVDFGSRRFHAGLIGGVSHVATAPQPVLGMVFAPFARELERCVPRNMVTGLEVMILNSLDGDMSSLHVLWRVEK